MLLNTLRRQGREETEENHYLLLYIRLAINPPGIEYNLFLENNYSGL